MADRRTREHNIQILLRAREGDLLEFPRGMYSHWAVYVGHKQVVHLAGEPGDDLVSADVAVRLDDFWTVAGESRAIINNSLDAEERALPPAEVVKRALDKQRHRGYNLLFTNCEHFVTWCRYNKARSVQMEALHSAINIMGMELKKILDEEVATNPDESKRALASELLGLGQKLAQAKDKFIRRSKSEQLEGLTPTEDGPSSSKWT